MSGAKVARQMLCLISYQSTGTLMARASNFIVVVPYICCPLVFTFLRRKSGM
jgi:hypothetical protein